MEQETFSQLEHASKKRRTRREVFLGKKDRLVPWERLEKRIEPFYPKTGRGRIRFGRCCGSIASSFSTTRATRGWTICSMRWSRGRQYQRS